MSKWHVNYRKFTQIVDDSGNLIAEYKGAGSLADKQNNSRILAASKDLLQACEYALRRTDPVLDGVKYDMLRRAILKAGGNATNE